MTPKRSLLLAVFCLGFLANSGREAQAQSLADTASQALSDLDNGYEYAAAFEDLYASEGSAAESRNAAMAYVNAVNALDYAGYDNYGQNYDDATIAVNYADMAVNYAYYAYFDNPSYSTYYAWYFLYNGAIAAQDVVNDLLSLGY